MIHPLEKKLILIVCYLTLSLPQKVAEQKEEEKRLKDEEKKVKFNLKIIKEKSIKLFFRKN